MKLRLSGATVRFRLSRADLEQLTLHGRVAADLGVDSPESRRWSYCVELDPDLKDLAAELEESGLRVRLPAAAGSRWLASDDEGIYGDSRGLAVSVERDFRCLHRDSQAEK